MTFKSATTAVAMLLAGATLAHAETTVVFNKYLAEKNEIMSTGVLPWAKAVETESGGDVKIEFTASSLAPPPAQLDMISSGIADASMNISSFTASQWLAPLIAELPMQFKSASAEAHSIALWRTYDKFFREAEKLDGVHVVALWALSGNHVWNNVRPIKTIDDAKGLKLRVNPNGTEAAVALGAVVVSRPAVESYELVTRGVVDGTLLPISSIQGLRLLKDIKYGTLFGNGIYRSTVSIIFNENFWNNMPEKDRAAIDKVSGEYLARLAGANIDKSDTEVRALLEPSGIEVNEISAEEMEKLAAKTTDAKEKWAMRVKEKGLDPEEILAYYREQLTTTSK